MMEGTGMHRHSSVRQIAYKIRISSAQVERKSSRAARGHRAKVLPKCETIISIPCAVGERRVAVFPLFRAVIPLLCAAVFRAKSHVRQRVSGKNARKRGLSAARLLLRPRHFGQRAANFRGVCRRGLLQIGCKCSKKRPPPAGGRSGPAQFRSGCKSAANAARRRPRPFSCAKEIRRTARCTASRESRSR